MTGYELKKFFDTSVAHFWNAELSQIYPTLRQLESEGLVEMKVQVQEDRPNRKVYSITDDGRRDLVDWLGTPADPDHVREPLMIKVFFGASMSKEAMVRVLRRRIEEMETANRHYDRGCTVIERLATGIGMKREAMFWDLTLDAGRRHNESAIAWAEETIAKIEQLDDSFFRDRPLHVGQMDVRLAVEVLEKLKAEMPYALASVERARNDES